ncbi:MAG: TraR/DksA C4-type zinc finger protein [Bdellovibrio sp.]|nr:TraR/DksA C4-type zinc finger protein [Bdellovibrio sp.]
MDCEVKMKYQELFETEMQRLIYSGEVLNQDLFLNEEDLRYRLRNREALFINKIKDALEKIRNNTFGICEKCGEPIESKRLEARPMTKLCLSCKEEEEFKENLHMDGRRHKSLGVY